MKSILTLTLFISILPNLFGQKANEDGFLYQLEEGQSTGTPDSVIELRNSCQLIYSFGNIFNSIYLKNQNDKTFVVDMRSPDEKGSVKLIADSVEYVIFEVVGPKITSEPRDLKVIKKSGKRTWIDYRAQPF